MLAEPIYINQDNSFDRLIFAAFIALLLHAVFILGIGFSLPKDDDRTPVNRHLEISIVQQANAVLDENQQAEILSDIAQQGGGNVETLDDAPTVSQALLNAQPVGEESSATTQSPQNNTPKWQTEVLTTIGESSFIVAKPAEKPQENEVETPAEQEAIAQTEEQASNLAFELDVEDQFDAQKASDDEQRQAETRVAVEAQYVASILKTLETFGSQKINGSSVYDFIQKNDAIAPTISFIINSNGTIRDIKIVRSSRSQFVDDFFKSLIRNVAPFDPIPPEVLEVQENIEIVKQFEIDR